MFADVQRAFAALGLFAMLATSAAAQGAAASEPSSAASLGHALSAQAAVPAAQAVMPPPTATAVAVASPAMAATADELTRLQDQTMLLQAQLKELEAQQAVDTHLRALQGTAVPSLGNVSVIAVERIGATRVATVRLNDGGEIEVAPGDLLIDGTRVVSIDDDMVAIRQRDGKIAHLRVGLGQGGSAPVLGDTQAAPANGPIVMMHSQGKPE